MNGVMDRIHDNAGREEIVRQANAAWWRAGVRRADRTRLRTDLAEELAGAADNGLDADVVVGDDVRTMARAWADERGMTGRALRLGMVLSCAIGAILVGLGVVLAALYLAFTDSAGDLGGSSSAPATALTLGFYASAGLLGYLCALAAVSGALSAVGDPVVRSTTKWLAALLPIGAMVSIGSGVGIASWHGFHTRPEVFIEVITAVVVVLVVTIGLARYAAVSRFRRVADSPMGV